MQRPHGCDSSVTKNAPVRPLAAYPLHLVPVGDLGVSRCGSLSSGHARAVAESFMLHGFQVRSMGCAACQ